MNYIIYHTKREISEIADLKIYHDKFKTNQDPYIWNEKFLHTFCHMTQISVKERDRIFWVFGDNGLNSKRMYCDCVFEIAEKQYWITANDILLTDPIVDNLQTYMHHYRWAKCQHHLERRRRYTLKADSEKSYQPQNGNGELIDITPLLNKEGLSTEKLIKELFFSKNDKRLRNTKPFKLNDDLSSKLYDYLWEISTVKIKGIDIQNLHPNKQ